MSEILVIAEHLNNQIPDITLEIIGAGVRLKDQLGLPLSIVVIAPAPSQISAELNYAGVDRIIEVTVPSQSFDPVIHEEVICELIEQRKSAVVLIPHSVSGMAYGPPVGARLGSGFASDILSISAEQGQLRAIRSIYENKVHMEVEFPGKSVVVLMLRGATFQPVEGVGNVEISTFSPDSEKLKCHWEHLEYIDAPVSDIDISKAEFILSIGRGIGDQEHVTRFSGLADKIGATLGCSRPLADSGWLPKPHQVGLSGKMAANCKLYLALGISGAVQHLHGMKHVDTIVAVNSDPNAPIFNVATYGICGDVFEFADELEKIV